MSSLEELKRAREQLGSQLLASLFQIILLLLVPVFLSVLLGNFLNQKFQTGDLLTFFLACVALALSWIPIWKIYKKIDTRMVELDSLIREYSKEKEKN